jgi:membrane fusion protein (multidrug efflux system)
MKITVGIITVAVLLASGVWYVNRDARPPGGPPGGAPVLVVIEPVARETLANTVEALGTASAKESITLTASLTDTVRRVNFEDSQYVAAGTVLVELTDEEEEAQLAEAQANLQEANRQWRRIEDLDAQGIVAASDVDKAKLAVEAAEARLNTIVARLDDRLIRAPFSGLLGFRRVSPGALVTPGDTITTLDDISQINLDFTVPEMFLAVIQPGRKVYARSATWKDRQFEGVVKAVGSRVDPSTRTVEVRAVIDNKDRALRPGMLLTVQVVADERSALLVPERSVVQVSDRAHVYLVQADQRVRAQPVELGLRQAGTVEVTQGLAEGDRIVTDGVVKLRDGVVVRAAGENDARGPTAAGGVGRPRAESGDGGA